MTRFVPLLIFASCLVAIACSDFEDLVHPSYDPCAPGSSCGLMTTCVPAALTTSDAGASICTAHCTEDRDCPGVSARCISTPSDAGAPSGQCFRTCLRSLDCRNGTTCHALLLGGQRQGVCVRDTGPRRCNVAAECAPFADFCIDGNPDASAGVPTDAALVGSCRIGAINP